MGIPFDPDDFFDRVSTGSDSVKVADEVFDATAEERPVKRSIFEQVASTAQALAQPLSIEGLETKKSILGGVAGAFGIDAFKESQEENRVASVTGEVLGTAGLGGAALKGAKVITSAAKPFARKLLPFMTRNTQSAKILKDAGIIASESVIATSLFDAARREIPKPEDVAIFAAIDLALPGFSRIAGKIFGRRDAAKVLKDISKGKTRLNEFADAATSKEVDRLSKAFEKGEERIREPAEKLGREIKKTREETERLKRATTQPKGVRPGEKISQKEAIGKTKIEKFKPEAQPQIKDTIEQFGSEIRKQRRGKRPISVTVKVAEKQKPLIQKAIRGEIKPGTAFNAEELEAVGGAVNELALKVKKNPNLIKDENFQKGFSNISKTYFGGATEAGRSLRQLKEERAILDFDALEFIQKEAGFDQLQEFLSKNKQLPPTMLNKFIEFARNMKLWSASAPVRSVVGNSTMQMFKFAETGISSVLNRAVSSLSRGRIQQDRFAREVIEDFIGMRSGLGEGFEAAGNILKENDKFLAESLFLQREFGKTARRAIRGEKGRIIRFGQNIQGAIDAVFRIPAGRGEARRRAVRKALQEGLEGSQLHNRIEELSKQFLDDPKIIREIQEVAATQTFQAELGELGQIVNRFRQGAGGLPQLVIPFFNTAANLFKEFIKRTPLELLNWNKFWKRDVANAVKRKEIGGLTDSLSKMITGTTFFVTTNQLVSKIMGGTIHGRGPDSKAKRDQLFANGWQPYSIQVGDRFVSYLGFEPISSFLGAMSDWNAGKKEGGNRRAIEKSFGNIVDTFAENPFLQGIVDTADLARGRKDFGVWLSRIAAGSVIPSIVRQTNTVFRPALKRRPETFTEALSNAFLLNKVEDRFNPLGQKAVRRGAIGNIFALRVTKKRGDPVLNELEKTDTNIGDPTSFKSVKLSRSEVNRINDIAGKAIYRSILNLMSNPTYAKLDNEDKKRIIINTKNSVLAEQKKVVFGLRGEKLQGANQ